MLFTDLKHIETKEEVRTALEDNENLVVCCGRMGPMCVPVYAIMKELETECPHVTFYDQDFDIPAANYIRSLPECRYFMGLPFTVYFKNGKVVAATSSIQRKDEMRKIIERVFVKQ